ncbi:MAG: PliI family lysozyme inhibitor of I-type lysozyme [Aeromonas sp.]
MNKILMMLGLLTLPLAANANTGLAKQLTLPSGQLIQVAPGTGEPASIGSYDVRLYANQNPDFPLDEFLDGKVMPRDGVIKTLQLADLNGDSQPELLVIIENVGTGSTLDVDSYTINSHGELELFQQVKDLAPKEDVIKALTSPQD